MSNTEYATYYQALTTKYQSIRPQVLKWASRLTLAQLTEELQKNGVNHITDLVDVVTRKQTLAA
jgi:hypothetical protein